jgi:hypothetical protein
MRFFLAFLLTKVLRIAQVTTPLATTRIVAASMIHPPHDRCGTNKRMSTRNASSDMRRVGSTSMMSPRRYLEECDAAWVCDVTANTKQTRVRSAATGCTMRIEDNDLRADGDKVN